MTEYFRITGLNNIVFDGTPASRNYDITGVPTGMSRVLTKSEVLQQLDGLPEEIRGHVLKRGLSIIEVPFKVYGPRGAFTDSDLEDRLHDIHETLEDAKLYIATHYIRGTAAQFKFQLNNATQPSYKTVYWGEVDERAARTVFEDSIKCQMMEGLRLTLYCEPYWRPNIITNLVNAVTVFNHDDAGAGHDNYVDIAAANILGDVPPRLRVRVMDMEGDKFKFIYLARRAARTPASFIHWREAETATALVNWVPLVSLLRSNGNVVEDPAPSLNTSGSARWQVAGSLNYLGRFAIFASLWTDNIANSQFRSLVRFSAPTTNYLESQWKKLTQASTWQLLRLGELELDFSKFASIGGLSQFNIVLEYQKSAGVAAQCDYIFLLPIDESVMRLDGHTCLHAGNLPDMAEVAEIWTFSYLGLGDSLNQDYYAPLNLLGEPLTLQPGRNNRIYLKALSVATATDPFSAHIDLIKNNGAPATRVTLTIDYLPQFISPLE